MAHDYVIGDFMWAGIDYLREARWPAKGSQSGVIDMTNKPKRRLLFLSSQWADKQVYIFFLTGTGRSAKGRYLFWFLQTATRLNILKWKILWCKVSAISALRNFRRLDRYDCPAVNTIHKSIVRLDIFF